MGKISKALEKAQNKPAFRPKQKPAPVKKQIDEATTGQNEVEHIPQSLNSPHNREGRGNDWDVGSRAMANDAETINNTVKPLASDFTTAPDSRGSNSSALNQDYNVHGESNNPSFHKANEERDEFRSRSDRADDKKPVRVHYSKTKVQPSDPERLKNNRVLSLFEDFETTNQFKMLRTKVLRSLKTLGGNSILVTSANPCEGKTFTSINLGISIAKEFDRTVLIIDADIRRPLKQHTDFATEFFSLEVDKGLADYLEGEADIEDILINPGIEKLTLIPGGMPVDNSPELLNSARMETMMAELKNRYKDDRLVILDGPAILHYPDAMILYKYVDGVLPVIESEKTSTENVKKMMELLQEVNILGVVMNKNRG